MSAATSEDGVWRALANSYRRAVLDLLREGPLTTGAIATRLPGLSRFAVMQHLGVLEETGLVLVRREGRHRFNFLNAVPLQQAYERWVGRFAGEAAARATALKRFVEGEVPMAAATQQRSARTVRIENEISLDAAPERVWTAITDEQMKWYPHHYGVGRVKDVVFEHRVGGRLFEDWGDGAGVLYGTITYYDPPKVYATRGHLRGGTVLEQWLVLEPRDGGTVLKYSMVTFGELSEDDEAGIRSHGDLSKYADSLRAWVERGEALSA